MRSLIEYPYIIQGGMGVGVSGWQLARAVAQAGQLGVVSGVGLDTVLVRRLQDADIGGHLRRAMSQFPIPETAMDVLRRFFRAERRSRNTRYASLALPKAKMDAARQRLIMLASFVHIWLAKEGHDGPIGINLLTKIRVPTLPALYGALMAGVDYVLMGAGIPREIPDALDKLAEHRPAEIPFEVMVESEQKSSVLRFDPREHWHSEALLHRPLFLPIVASNLLASVLARKAIGRVDGFVVEGPTAGGHNAPPRGKTRLNTRGEPVYGERDAVDLGKIRDLGLPFWVAGGSGSPESLQEAQAVGAAGIQAGTLFAYCDESGMREDLKRSVLSCASSGAIDVRTDRRASPTGYPFKIVEWAADPSRRGERQRVCDLGYLREAYRRPDGRIGYRCAAEPVDAYREKGGSLEDTAGRRCLCNALMATIGVAQVRGDEQECPIVTSGDALANIGRFLAGRVRYTAADVVSYLLGKS